MFGEIGDQGLEPLAFGAGLGAGDVGIIVGGSELADPDGGNSCLANEAPVALIEGREGGRRRAGIEPALLILGGTVDVNRVDEAAGDGKPDGRGADAGKVSAPEVGLGADGVGAFDEDQEAGVGVEDGVSGTLCGEVPIRGAAAGPAGAAFAGIVRLVA